MPGIEANNANHFMRLMLQPLICALLFASFAIQLRGADMAPDFTKLAPVPLYSSAKEAARTNQIPTEGVDAVSQPDVLRTGDSVTALISLFEKRGEKSQWLLHVEAVEPTAQDKARKAPPSSTWYVGAGDKVTFGGSAAPVRLRLLGPFAPGSTKAPRFQVQETRITLNPGFLSIGLDQAAAAFHRIRQNNLHGKLPIRPRPFTEAEIADGKKAVAVLQLSAGEQRAIAGSQLALMSYIHLVQQAPGLDSIFYKVVKLPSVWSVVRNIGVNTSINLEKDHVSPISVSNWNLLPDMPSYTFPLSLQV
ncbi:MAG: hypothetical protein JWM16_4327, partial [Verrucomicrobiales bacterium]|nr:hypothetical protein [Verrucomicrobiales bacterium]